MELTEYAITDTSSPSPFDGKIFWSFIQIFLLMTMSTL